MAADTDRIARALANIKSPVYSAGDAAQLLAGADTDFIGENLSGVGDSIHGIGTSLSKYATDQAAAQLAAQSRAGMQIDPKTGLPIDPRGEGVAELMASARAAQQNVNPLYLDRIEPIPAITDPNTGETTQEVVPGRSAGFNPNFDPSNLAGMVDFKSLSDTADALGDKRRKASEELRKVAGEKQLRSLDKFNYDKADLENQLVQQQLIIRGHQDRRNELQARMKQEEDAEKVIKMRLEYDQLEEQIPFLLQELQTNIANKNASTGLTTAQAKSLGVGDDKTREEIKKLKAENETAERKEKDRKAMAAQPALIDEAGKKDAAAIKAAADKGEVAPELNFYKSNVFDAYNKAIKSNAGNTRTNKLLQENFAQLLREQDLPITDEQLIKAGVATVNKEGEITGYNYAPAAQKNLDRILSSAFATKFGPGNRPSPTILKMLREGAIAQRENLSVGFKDARARAKKDEDTRNKKDFLKTVQFDRVKANLPDTPVGPKLKAKVDELDKKWRKGPYVENRLESINKILQPARDRLLKGDKTSYDLADGTWGKADGVEPGDKQYGKIKWNQGLLNKNELSPINLKDKTTRLASFTTFEEELFDVIAEDNQGASLKAIQEKASRSLAAIPNYTTAKFRAKLRYNAAVKVSAVHEGTPEKEAIAVQDMEAAIEDRGHIGYISNYLRTKNKNAYENMNEPDLIESLNTTIARAEKLYPGLTASKSGKAQLYHAVKKMYSGSTGESDTFWHDVVGVKGTEWNKMQLPIFNLENLSSPSTWLVLHDKGLNEISDDLFMEAMDDELPFNQLDDTQTIDATITNLEAQIEVYKRRRNQ